MAYESNGSVYLSITDFKKKGHDYRKLKPSKACLPDSPSIITGISIVLLKC